MKKLLELRQQKAALKTQMRSMLDKADTEKRSLNEEEGKKFDELRAEADALEVEITRLEAVADDQRNLPGTSVQGEPVSNDELRHYIMTGDILSLAWKSRTVHFSPNILNCVALAITVAAGLN